jgi:hypothetical protein
MSETYANNIDRANDFIQNYKQGQAEVANEAATTQLEQYLDKANEIRNHYAHEASEGGEEIGGAAAAHMIFNKARELYGKYKATRDKNANQKEPNNDEEDDARTKEEEGEGDENIDDAGNRPVAAGADSSADAGGQLATASSGTAEGMGSGVEGTDSVFDLARKAIGSNPEGSLTQEARSQVFKNRLAELGDDPVPEQGGTDAGGVGGRATAISDGAQGSGAPEEPRMVDAFSTDAGDFQVSKGGGAISDLLNYYRGTKGIPSDQLLSTSKPAPTASAGGSSTATGGGDIGGSLDINSTASGAPKPSGLSQTKTQDAIQDQDPEKSIVGDVEGDIGGAGGELEQSGAKIAEKTGGSILGDLGESVGLDAIPVIGEAAAVVQGLVGIGEGIYHLFHPDHTKPPPPPKFVGRTPSNIASKFSAALPSMDGSVEDSAGSMSAF